MSKIRVMIVEDSLVVREFLQHLIGRDPRLEVVAAVESGEKALKILHKASPDVISMDIRLPGMNGFETTQRIMSERPTPIVVVSASIESEDLKISMNALRAGALSVVEKPVGETHKDYDVLSHRLCAQLALMSQVKVVRQRIARARTFMPPASRPARPPRPSAPDQRTLVIVGIGTSTGGPNALQKLFSTLSPGFPLPILLVQHISPSFTDGFVSWLGSISPLPVSLAINGESPQPGHVYVPPAERHLRVKGGTLRLDDGPPVSGQRPSATVLFESLALEYGTRVLGVLLTGMGDDGAAGLKQLRDAGAYTIAEDETTAVVYGMPAVAVSLGAVCESLPLDAIGPRMQQLLLPAKEPSR
jgi:two-component system, chemotaxis family, protein-glutamate methylesterase/glutaminase